ncbi:MAG: hypothetical protein KDA93_01405 [Planctomycetaceae bacterium]|nr:hypothetical protein [Planctomycetaceae bacterium]
MAKLLREKFSWLGTFPDGDLYPTYHVPMIRAKNDGEYEIINLLWGMVPSWWKPKGKQTWKM